MSQAAGGATRGREHRPLLPQGSPSHAPCASRLMHSSTAEGAKRLAVMSSSVPWRCRVTLVSRPGGRRGRTW